MTHLGIRQDLQVQDEGKPRDMAPAVYVDNPQVQGIIVAIPKGGSDKYGVSNPQGAKGKTNILSSPICH